MKTFEMDELWHNLAEMTICNTTYHTTVERCTVDMLTNSGEVQVERAEGGKSQRAAQNILRPPSLAKQLTQISQHKTVPTQPLLQSPVRQLIWLADAQLSHNCSKPMQAVNSRCRQKRRTLHHLLLNHQITALSVWLGPLCLNPNDTNENHHRTTKIQTFGFSRFGTTNQTHHADLTSVAMPEIPTVDPSLLPGYTFRDNGR